MVRDISDRSGTLDTLCTPDSVARHLNRATQARGTYEQACAIAQRVRDRANPRRMLHALGELAAPAGGSEEALQDHDRARAPVRVAPGSGPP
jgi:hypothetical protein